MFVAIHELWARAAPMLVSFPREAGDAIGESLPRMGARGKEKKRAPARAWHESRGPEGFRFPLHPSALGSLSSVALSSVG